MQLYRPGNIVAERYEIKEVLGQGPVGATYVALDKELEEDVALKVIAAELLSSETLREFEAIFDKVTNFSHRNLRKLYEYQVEGSIALYTGVYHKGESLRQMMQGRKVFSHLEAEPILSQICQALTAAEKITAHGAIRPENILVLPDTIKVTDLGIAASLGSTYNATLRKGGASRYLAPELKSGGAISTRSDVYSLGVLFYEMLSGEPYDGSVASFASRNSSLPPALDDVAKIALAANPNERYANANEFGEDLASVIDTGKIKPRANIPSVAAAVSSPSLAAIPGPTAALPQETVITPAKAEEPPPLSVPDDAIELSVIAAPKVPEISRIEDVATFGADSERTVVRANPSSVPAMAPIQIDPDESTGLRTTPTRPPISARSSKDPAEDLFDSALQQSQKPKTPERRSPPVAAATPPPMPAPTLPRTSPSGAAPAAEPPPSTALARASDVPVVAPPTQGAVVLPGWALGMFGALLLGLFGVVIFLLVRTPPQPQPIYQPLPNPVAVNQPETKPQPVLEPKTKPQPAASTQVASTSTSTPTTGPSTLIALNTTSPANDPKLPGVDPKNTDPKNSTDPKLNPTDPKNSTDPKNPNDPKNTDPKNSTDPKLNPTAVKAGTCPGGMQKLTVGKDKREYCIDRYEFPNAKGATPQTGVDYGTAEATCKSKGKRLCTGEEWGRGCGGAYPYGKDFDASACNTKDADDNPRSVAAAGSFPKCKSGGIYDMSGNVEEWVEGSSKRGGSAKSGDTFATCGKSTKGGASEFTGFRCCADPKVAP